MIFSRRLVNALYDTRADARRPIWRLDIFLRRHSTDQWIFVFVERRIFHWVCLRVRRTDDPMRERVAKYPFLPRRPFINPGGVEPTAHSASPVKVALDGVN